MKPVLHLFLTVFVLTSLAQSAGAACSLASGLYQIRGSYFGSNIISGIWGKTRVTAGSPYSLASLVKDYADPLKTGSQTLTLTPGSNGTCLAAIYNSDRSLAGKGAFYQSVWGATLAVSRQGCGGEMPSSNCGVYLYFQSVPGKL